MRHLLYFKYASNYKKWVRSRHYVLTETDMIHQCRRMIGSPIYLTLKFNYRASVNNTRDLTTAAKTGITPVRLPSVTNL